LDFSEDFLAIGFTAALEAHAEEIASAIIDFLGP
jgi:hypothetical protein